LKVARSICDSQRRRSRCTAHFWLDESQAATGLPFTDDEAHSRHAAYGRNTVAGLDGWKCHPFGTPEERCQTGQ
jgi:hypothetical protein